MRGGTRPTRADSSAKQCEFRLYASNIQGRGGGAGDKMHQLQVRTDDCDFVILNEVNCRSGDENSVALGCRAVALTDGGESTKTRGFGTAVLSKTYNPETDSILFRSSACEISAIRRKSEPRGYCDRYWCLSKSKCFRREAEKVLG